MLTPDVDETARLRLRSSRYDDLNFVIATEHAEANRIYITPWSKEKHEEALQNPDVAHLIAEDRIQGRPVGYVIVTGLQNENRSIELLRITIAEKGQGYGRDAIRLVKQWAFERLHGNRLWLDVKEHNLRARKLYESEGFVWEGTLRECLRSDDRYESLHVFSILRREYAAASEN